MFDHEAAPTNDVNSGYTDTLRYRRTFQSIKSFLEFNCKSANGGITSSNIVLKAHNIVFNEGH